MKLIELINLGGPVNWLLTVLFLFCVCLCIERIVYYTQTFHNHKYFYIDRMNNKCKEIEELSYKEKKKELEKEVTLIYGEMNQGLWLINFISAVAPSLGLLGTVTGLIGAFKGMSNGGAQINIQDLSGGIWEAMLTTAFGMIISIPSLFFYRTFKRIIEKRTIKISLIMEDVLAAEGNTNE